MLKHYLIEFFISMLPLIELRGAIPYSQLAGLPLLPAYVVAIIGNMIPVPFIFLFARKVLEFGSNLPGVPGRFCRYCMQKGERGGRLGALNLFRVPVIITGPVSGKNSRRGPYSRGIRGGMPRI